MWFWKKTTRPTCVDDQHEFIMVNKPHRVTGVILRGKHWYKPGVEQVKFCPRCGAERTLTGEVKWGQWDYCFFGWGRAKEKGAE